MNDAIVRVAITTLVSAVIAALWVLARRGFGFYDLVPFGFGSVAFGLWVALVAHLFRDVLERPNGLARFGSVALLGIVSALVWTVMVTWLLGPWVLAFSLPIASIWALAAITALIPRVPQGPDRLNTRDN